MLSRALCSRVPRVTFVLPRRTFSQSAAQSASKKTYYDVLGVTRKATDKDLKEVYRRLAKKYHPDHNADDPEAEARFKEVQEAYACLSNRWKRALYDQDLQFGASEVQGTDADQFKQWKENFDNETPEEREARKERYRRYAKGERNDIPPLQYPPRVIPLVFLVGTVGIFYVCIKAPEWLDIEFHATYNDPATDDRSVPLVRAFHDPVLNRWERLPDGCEAPSPLELYDYYRKVKPDIMKGLDLKPLPKVQLTVLNVPRTDAVQATFKKKAATGMLSNAQAA
mmetsp:Transcript_46862/g.111529  ORF Transcript_46862/g.111529 Transcript_46862/m.111529 type:complete len:282 (+) Transcript_46862:98-943(+)